MGLFDIDFQEDFVDISTLFELECMDDPDVRYVCGSVGPIEVYDPTQEVFYRRREELLKYAWQDLARNVSVNIDDKGRVRLDCDSLAKWAVNYFNCSPKYKQEVAIKSYTSCISSCADIVHYVIEFKKPVVEYYPYLIRLSLKAKKL